MLRREKTPVSLFPMFNILVCTLGVLIFVLGAVATLSIGVDKSISIGVQTYKGSTTEKQPCYIEWDGASLMLHPNGEKVTFRREWRKFSNFKEAYEYIESEIAKSPIKDPLAQFLVDTKHQYIILLVRPSGFDNLLLIRGYFEQLGTDIGYEPIDQEWNVRIR